MDICSVPILSALIGACVATSPLGTGYVEGDHVLLAPLATAQVESLAVARGQRFELGDVLARQERRDAELSVAQAAAALAQAESQLRNLREGRRPEEIQVIEASLASATAQLAEYERQLARLSTLEARGAASEAQREDAETAVSVARASVAQIEANLAVARLPARPEEIAAAEAAVQAASADLDKARWTLAKRDLTAPAAGVVSDILRMPGEMAGPSAPVFSLLPDGAIKLRLYIPEGEIAALSTGTRLSVHCDGCAEGLHARISYIADGPEFTPPVIYSLQNRQKLVYLVEALPEGEASLKPGQIVDVSLAEAAK
ncbi:HlyD family efflux transporter periplasmic adaptor subunit [Sinirhodobacter sp. WL0062]|uniref:HlyD family efflux transporter periplasmic adaptor subunit n=1 Tax=Rhodobacter flavimaris TaxID=2907145 RepID=A0ABS8YWC2_9RHOB|nr:HlyD family efflux transporter periplasmic adaptor subunit [Sinirhodobacter sp. WL0062]MCE5974116.1 HlyD family efflux transporter periplasmic adaptor subunit [Sinirhodobacter sp. WL0062]